MINQPKILRVLVMMMTSMILTAGSMYAQDDSIIDQLGLTSAQREQIQKLKDRFIQDSSPLRADIKRLLEDEKRLKGLPKPPEAELRQKMKERADKEIELSILLTRFNEGVEGILTPAQRKKLEQLRAARNK